MREIFCSLRNISHWKIMAAGNESIDPAAANAVAVNATLYYQSIPPYYLRQRAEEGHGPDTARLVNFANQLNVGNYPEIADWKLKIATSGPVNLQ